MWNDPGADPLADIQAAMDMILNKRGLEFPIMYQCRLCNSYFAPDEPHLHPDCLIATCRTLATDLNYTLQSVEYLEDYRQWAVNFKCRVGEQILDRRILLFNDEVYTALQHGHLYEAIWDQLIDQE